MEVRREARLGEEADDLVQRGSWPSTRRTPKSFHGLVWSSSVRFKLSEKNSGHGMTQEEFDRARTMVFVGPGHLLPGAIKAMFRPKTRHETSLEVGPGVNNLEDLTRATVPRTTASVFHVFLVSKWLTSFCFEISFVEPWGFFCFNERVHCHPRRRRQVLK